VHSYRKSDLQFCSIMCLVFLQSGVAGAKSGVADIEFDEGVSRDVCLCLGNMMIRIHF
jgi:hypothetical protein